MKPTTESADDPSGKLKSGRWAWSIPLAVVLMAAGPVAAQVTTSNIDHAFWGNYSITLNNWQSGSFSTDSFGYTLNQVQLRLATPIDSSGNLFVGLYSNTGSLTPGTLLETLSGPSNPASNYVTYTSAGLSLAPNTYYHVVVGVTAGAGNYQWLSTNDPNQSGPWDIQYQFSTSTNQGSSWPAQTALAMEFAVTATAIPEPSTYAALAGLGALGLTVWRRGKSRLAQIS